MLEANSESDETKLGVHLRCACNLLYTVNCAQLDTPAIWSVSCTSTVVDSLDSPGLRHGFNGRIIFFRSLKHVPSGSCVLSFFLKLREKDNLGILRASFALCCQWNESLPPQQWHFARSRSEKSALALVWSCEASLECCAMICPICFELFWCHVLEPVILYWLYWLSITFRVERRKHSTDLNCKAQPEGRHDAVLAEQIRNSDSIWCCQSMLRPKPRFFSV